MEETKDEAIVVRLNPAARQVIEQVREDTGIPKVQALARVLNWFSTFDRKARLAILTNDPDLQRELADMVLREMAGRKDGEVIATSPGAAAPLSYEQCSAVMRAVLDRMDQIERSHGNIVKERLSTKH